MTPEKIEYLPLNSLQTFPNHPFKVENDRDMEDLIQSIIFHENVLVPLLIWERAEGEYIVLGGHRRKKACEILNERYNTGITLMPCLVYRDIDIDVATIIMVDDNCKREKLLPSEKAWAYRMKMEALKRQGERTDLTSTQVAWKSENPNRQMVATSSTTDLTLCPLDIKLNSAQEIAGSSSDSVRQVFRFIRLTYLIPVLMQMVDGGHLGFRASVEISYLPQEEQQTLALIINDMNIYPTLKQSIALKAKAQGGELSEKEIRDILSETSLNDRVCFRATPVQLTQLIEESEKTGATKSEILRSYSATGGAVYVGKDSIGELMDTRLEVSRVGNLLKMHQNKLDMISQNPLLAQSDRDVVLDIIHEAGKLQRELDELRRELVRLCTRIGKDVSKLNNGKR